MKKTQTHKKNQSFVLFWLGLLTGALLVVALYSASGSEDLSGSLKKDASMKRYEVGKYEDKAHRAAYDDGYNMYGSVPGDNYGSVPADNYGLNSIMHVEENTLSREEYKVTFDVGFNDASMKRYEVGKYEDKAHRAAYDDGYNMYGSLPGDNYGSVPADNYGLNSILNLKLEPVLSQTEYKKTFDVGYKDASMKRYEVGKYADKAHRAAYDDGYDMYGSLPGDNYGSLPADNYGF